MMSLIYGQFWNQTMSRWDWQQIGGPCPDEDIAKGYAEGFAITYGMITKVVSRKGTLMYLPPKDKTPLVWPEIQPELIPQ